MSNFFSLGGGGEGGKDQEHPHNHHQQQQDNSLYLFKNEEIYNKGGFEQWQQYHQLQQLRSSSTQDVDFSVGPSSRRIISTSSGDDKPSLSYDDNRSSHFRVTTRYGSSTSGSRSINCQDCGNQAKKDCIHMRCRTCCKSRRFHCDTHVKSTWVPAAKRRERLQNQQIVSLQHHQNQDQSQDKSQNQVTLRGGDENYTPKRPRDNYISRGGNSPSLPSTRLTTSSSGLEVGAHFPAKVNSPAMFRCIKVSNAVDGEEQYAYMTAVNIGGHVFEGILYDQGPDTTSYCGGEGSSGGGGVHHHQQQPINLITASTTTNTTTTTTSTMAANVGVTVLDASVYPTPLGAFMAGTTFFQPPRS
ncbi:hypothetical protein Leryth_010599 [Lithospermum erythrorhizon]|nr:hypothetical protein Leryth_010599 [Lithospermum erythrorhizon]